MNIQALLGKSWKTSSNGWASVLAGLALLINQLNGDGLSGSELVEGLGFIAAGLVGVFARDKKVTSEQEGAGK
jgi:hypothetical protein